MNSFSKVLFVLVLSLFCSFFCVKMDVEASGTGTTWISTTAKFLDWSISYPSSSTSVTGTLSTTGSSTGTVANSGSITNYSGYFYTGSTLASYVDTVSGLEFDSFSALYTNSRYNGSTSVSLQSGTLYRCTGTNRDGIVVDCVCSNTSLSAYVYEFATAQVGSSAASTAKLTNKDSGTFSGTFTSSGYALSYVTMRLYTKDLFKYVDFNKEYNISFSMDFPPDFVCNGYVFIPQMSSVDKNTILGTAVFSNRDKCVLGYGTLNPTKKVNYIDFVLLFYMPLGVNFTNFNTETVSASYCVNPSDSNIVTDSLTRFEGSAAMDTSKGQLDTVIGDYDQIEGSLFDSGQTAFDQFDPSSLLNFSTGIYVSISYISQLMVSTISAMGEFSIIYTVGVVLVFFGMLIGLWRFFK